MLPVLQTGLLFFPAGASEYRQPQEPLLCILCADTLQNAIFVALFPIFSSMQQYLILKITVSLLFCIKERTRGQRWRQEESCPGNFGRNVLNCFEWQGRGGGE